VLRVNPGKGSHEQCEQCSHNAYGNAGKHDLLPQVGLVTLGHVGTQSINCAFVLCLLCVHAFLQSDKLLFDIAKSTVNVCHDSQFVANQSELSIMQKTNFVGLYVDFEAISLPPATTLTRSPHIEAGAPANAPFPDPVAVLRVGRSVHWFSSSLAATA